MKGLDGSFFAYPEQTGDAQIDLINQCQVFVALGVLDFIDANGIDLSQGPVFQSPGDDMLDSVENLIPASTKRLGSFFPRKAAPPASQEQHIGFGQCAFAAAPGSW